MRHQSRARCGFVNVSLMWLLILIAWMSDAVAQGATDPSLHSGELHATRIPREHWSHRPQMTKALGLNTVSTYVFWSRHEPEPGMFDWSGDKDIAEFCRMAQHEGLQVLIRPGPYVCGEYDLGGLPWWLLREREMRLRTRHPVYLNAVRRYYKAFGEPNKLDILGVANPTANVQVWKDSDSPSTASRNGEYFHLALTVANGSYPVVHAKSLFGTNQQATVGRSFVPPSTESFDYDADGNLTTVSGALQR